MIVSMWMAKNPYTALPDTPISEAAALMAGKHIRRLPVLDSASKSARLVGIVSATDVFKAFPEDRNPYAAIVGDCGTDQRVVADVMQRDPLTTAPDAPIEHAARAMRDHKIGALPVVRRAKLVGVITESDVFRAFVSMFDGDQDEVRVTFDVSGEENTFAMLSKLAVEHSVRVLSVMTSRQSDTPVCVVRLTGPGVEAMNDDLWRSGHRVVNVLRTRRDG